MLYYKYSDYLKNKYGEKVYKLPVNLPVTCPNRLDGDGCAFCAGAGTGFEAMAATVSAEYLDIMRDIRAMTGIQMNVELGLQTANYHTLQMIDRGHGLAEFIDAVLRIKRYTGISICTHVILNLPGDTAADAKETARILTALGVDIVKLHSLYIARNTRLCDWYENGKITVCSKEEYFERVIMFLEQIPETVAVERMFSRIPEKDAVFCNWGCSWWRLRDELLQKMEEEGRYQGRCCDYLNGAALCLLKSE